MRIARLYPRRASIALLFIISETLSFRSGSAVRPSYRDPAIAEAPAGKWPAEPKVVYPLKPAQDPNCPFPFHLPGPVGNRLHYQTQNYEKFTRRGINTTKKPPDSENRPYYFRTFVERLPPAAERLRKEIRAYKLHRPSPLRDGRRQGSEALPQIRISARSDQRPDIGQMREPGRRSVTDGRPRHGACSVPSSEP